MELIVFDLDGTLLNKASQISKFTRQTLQQLNELNIKFTIATGRTAHSAQGIVSGTGFHLPHIYCNGTVIWEPSKDTYQVTNDLNRHEISQLLSIAKNLQLSPFIFITQENQHYAYHDSSLTFIENYLLSELKSRKDLVISLIDESQKYTNITNISLIGDGEKIDAVSHFVAKTPDLISYSGPALEGDSYKWIDIHHCEASKGNAINALKHQLGVNKIVCFGDGENDLSMFKIADESYAPENAKEKVKSMATAVIGHHNEDGIAHFLRQKYLS